MAAALQLIADPETAAVLLQPDRMRMLELLAEPDSAAGLARRMELPRQQVNYHLRELERQGLVALVEERRKGNCTERVMRATARSYLVSPDVLGRLGADPNTALDQFSASFLIAVSAQAIRDVARMSAKAKRNHKRIATMTAQVDIRFANAAERAAFADDLTNALARLAQKYHSKDPGGRAYRVFAGAYPSPAESEPAQTENLNLE